jgi:uncharacterized protein (TIGR03083 family)
VIVLERDRAVAALDEAYDAVVALAEGLSADDWDRPTACPGWSVKDNVSHVIGIESLLLGRPTPEDSLPADIPHVHNDFGRVNEVWIDAFRAQAPEDVLAELRAVIAERRATLAGMDQAAFDAEAFTPAGPDTYGRFMRIRVMDIWYHDQDIREAIGRPGHFEGLAPEAALDEFTLAAGYVVGKLAGAPAGSSVRFELTGPMARRIDVEVTDRARVVDALDPATALDGEPTVTLTVPAAYLTRLVGGRGADPAVVEIAGDRALGEAVVTNLGYMM